MNTTDMNTARIAELLEPFLLAHPRSVARPDLKSEIQTTPNYRYSEPPKAGEAGPQPDGQPVLSPKKEEPAGLSPAQLKDISTYIDILIRWNARVNLTAIRDPEAIVTRHFGESLFAASHLFPHEPHGETFALDCPERGRPVEHTSAAVTLADIGSGAGFPGLPIKLWAPQIFLTLVESNHRKVVFLREITRALTLMNVNIQNARAEALTGNAFDVVTLRAVERFDSILVTLAALVSPTGRLALLLGSSQQNQARKLAGFAWSDPIPVPRSRSRILLIGHRQNTAA